MAAGVWPSFLVAAIDPPIHHVAETMAQGPSMIETLGD